MKKHEEILRVAVKYKDHSEWYVSDIGHDEWNDSWSEEGWRLIEMPRCQYEYYNYLHDTYHNAGRELRQLWKEANKCHTG